MLVQPITISSEPPYTHVCLVQPSMRVLLMGSGESAAARLLWDWLISFQNKNYLSVEYWETPHTHYMVGWSCSHEWVRLTLILCVWPALDICCTNVCLYLTPLTEAFSHENIGLGYMPDPSFPGIEGELAYLQIH